MANTWFPTRIWSNMSNELFIVHHRIPNSETFGIFKTNIIYFFAIAHQIKSKYIPW